MSEYKDTINRSHPYEGQAPESDIAEKLPVMTGHDDQIERMSGQGAPSMYSTPFFQEQTPQPSRLEEHSHPGDDAYLILPEGPNDGDGSHGSSHNPGPYLGGGMKPRY